MTHLEHLLGRRPELRACADSIASAHRLLADCYRAGGQILLCGNGGSAADCEHWAGELLKGFEARRPTALGDDPELGRLQGGLPALPLTGFTALRTAVANDLGGELEFAQLVVALGRPGDVLVGITTSGNANNVRLAARTAQARGLKILGLTGAGGGALAPLCDVCICVPEQRTCLVQELHLPIYHTLCLMLEDEFFPAQSG